MSPSKTTHLKKAKSSNDTASKKPRKRTVSVSESASEMSLSSESANKRRRQSKSSSSAARRRKKQTWKEKQKRKIQKLQEEQKKQQAITDSAIEALRKENQELMKQLQPWSNGTHPDLPKTLRKMQEQKARESQCIICLCGGGEGDAPVDLFSSCCGQAYHANCYIKQLKWAAKHKHQCESSSKCGVCRQPLPKLEAGICEVARPSQAFPNRRRTFNGTVVAGFDWRESHSGNSSSSSNFWNDDSSESSSSSSSESSSSESESSVSESDRDSNIDWIEESDSDNGSISSESSGSSDSDRNSLPDSDREDYQIERLFHESRDSPPFLSSNNIRRRSRRRISR